MTPTEILKHEHQIVLLVFKRAKRQIKLIEEGKPNAEELEGMVDFLRNFTDRCHYGKEEKYLFVKMQKRGLPVESGQIAAILREHQEGREQIDAVAVALAAAKMGDPSAIVSAKDNLLAYIALLRTHIDKEDNILFPLADRLFTPDDQKELTEAFERVDAMEMEEKIHGKFKKTY